MSRLIVKNLPKAITEEKLRKLFSQKGDITDIQLKYTPEGKFRQFCFIGYRTEEQAQEALNFFHNSCINTSKITVEVCSNLGDPNKPKSWSKYAPDSNKNLKTAKEKKLKENEEETKEKSKENTGIADLLNEHKSDPLFEEYLATKLKKSVWSNDNIIDNITGQIEHKKKNEDPEDEEASDSENETADNKLANAKISDLEYMKSLMVTKPRQKTEKAPKEKIDLFTVKLRGLPYNTTKKDIKHFFNPLVPFSIRVPRKVKGFAYVGFKTDKHFKKALLKDRSFLSGKRISVLQYTKKSQDENANQSVEKFKNVKWKDKEELLKNEEDIATSGKIFVRNLSYTTTEDDLQKLFEKYGPVTEVNLPIDKTTRQIKGFGTITFVFPEHAAKAYCELDGSILCGRMLHLLPEKTTDEINEKNNEDAKDGGYKKQKELKLKSEAGSSHNWNSLFVGMDTVANVVAETYGTTKENVLGAGVSDASSNNKNVSAAVRLALGETQIVQNIKDYLEQHDIHLDAFQTNVKKRSKTTLLVKNLPAQTEESEIRSLFSKFGPISRLILPPHGITAVVEFHEPTEARQAFKKLAYSKFKHVPLYLEWAPENTFKTPKSENSIQKESSAKQDITEKQNLDTNANAENESNSKPKVEYDEDDEQAEPDTVLFVKNLNFSTTDEILHKHFEKCGKICYANVATKKDPKHPGQKLSMGYGFVRYMYRSDCENALKTLQFSDLEGKSLELKRSSRTTESDVRTNASKKASTVEQNGTKIVIRNIPFQANKYELRDLFVPFGEIKALRLPQKMTGESHRGFGFVDFHTKNDAKRAFQSLSQSTHLYGRRLVLEWATNESDDVEMLRKRTVSQMQKVRGTHTSKKGRFDVSDDMEKEDD